jgi:ferredoxin-NADP reductase/MOSC domain-containing protein YiiM
MDSEEEVVMARLLSVNVGLPREVTWNGKTVRTSVYKLPVEGRVMARKLNIDGDAQADLAGHGGEHRAVFVYQMDSYQYWENFLGRHDFTFGQFGENFTVEGLLDSEVCIGDRYRIGDGIFEVTQPRVTCYRVGIRMNEPRMPALLVAHHRPGFYFRVIREGEVGAGDEIVKIIDGPERISVADVDALLYLPGHSREQMERALRIPALSKGWQESFEALLGQEPGEEGNPGLTAEESPPAWTGFRAMKVSHIIKESVSVSSFVLVPNDGQPLAAAEPGQFVVLRLKVNPDQPPILRSYSLSDLPGADSYRISVKLESKGVASSFLHNRVLEGDVLETSAPRGRFTLKSGRDPVVLLSAGVGATPVLAMLHALAAEDSEREVWWIYGARNGADHAFAKESRALLQKLTRGRCCILYSQPAPTDREGVDFNAPGHIDITLLEKLKIPRNGDFYLCGPPPFMESLRGGLPEWGVSPDKIHTEIFGALGASTPGVAPVLHIPHLPEGTPGVGPLVSFARSGITAAWDPKFESLLELAEACDVSVRWSCRSGVCHLCMSGLISGSIGYRPDPLESPEAGNLLVCCSQPKTDVVLDI